MIFKYELRFVAFTWPNHCLWVVILCAALVSKKPKNLFFVENLGLYQWAPAPANFVHLPHTSTEHTLTKLGSSSH